MRSAGDAASEIRSRVSATESNGPTGWRKACFEDCEYYGARCGECGENSQCVDLYGNSISFTTT